MNEKQIDFINAIKKATNGWSCEIIHHNWSLLGHPIFEVDIKFNESDWNSSASIITDALIDVAEDWEAGIDWDNNIISLSKLGI